MRTRATEQAEKLAVDVRVALDESATLTQKAGVWLSERLDEHVAEAGKRDAAVRERVDEIGRELRDAVAVAQQKLARDLGELRHLVQDVRRDAQGALQRAQSEMAAELAGVANQTNVQIDYVRQRQEELGTALSESRRLAATATGAAASGATPVTARNPTLTDVEEQMGSLQGSVAALRERLRASQAAIEAGATALASSDAAAGGGARPGATVGSAEHAFSRGGVPATRSAGDRDRGRRSPSPHAGSAGRLFGDVGSPSPSPGIVAEMGTATLGASRGALPRAVAWPTSSYRRPWTTGSIAEPPASAATGMRLSPQRQASPGASSMLSAAGIAAPTWAQLRGSGARATPVPPSAGVDAAGASRASTPMARFAPAPAQ